MDYKKILKWLGYLCAITAGLMVSKSLRVGAEINFYVVVPLAVISYFLVLKSN
jgi:hypothetical protein